jgi:CRP/FNR family transcriptional regulator
MSHPHASTHSQFSPDPKVAHALSQLRNFSGLSPRLLDVLSGVAITRKLKRGDILWKVDEPANFFSALTDGAVEVVRPAGGGKDAIVGFFGPGDLLGVFAHVKVGTFPATARCIAPKGEIIRIYGRNITRDLDLQLKHEYESWLKEMNLVHQQILMDKIEILEAGRVEARLLLLLKYLARRFGESTTKSKWTIRVPMTKSQMARFIDMRVETVIRMMNKWEKRGLLEMKKEAIVLPDLSTLEEEISHD